MSPRAHVLVCRGPDCTSRGSQDTYTAVALECERAGLLEDVVQTQTGCVGPLCGLGPVVCCYPSGAWYAGVDAGAATAIVREDLAEGRPVEAHLAVRVSA